MKYLLALICLLASLWTLNSQGFAYYQGPTALFPQSDLFQIFNTSLVAPNQIYTDDRGFGSYTLYNITLAQGQPSQVTIANASIINSTAIGYAYNLVIPVEVSFEFEDHDLFGFIQGTGNASLPIVSFQINKTFSDNGTGQPSITCELAATFSPNASVNINGGWPAAMGYMNDFISNSLGSVSFGVYLNQSCGDFYTNQTIHWPTNFYYDTQSAEGQYFHITFANDWSLLQFNNNGGFFGLNGSFDNYSVQGAFDTTVFNPLLGDQQIGTSLTFIQDFSDYFYQQGAYQWKFNQSSFPISTFDYSINEVSNFLPSIAYEFSPEQLISASCQYLSNTTLSLSPSPAQIVSSVPVSCNVFDPNANSLFNFTIRFNSSIAVTQLNGAIYLNIAQTSYDSLNPTIPLSSSDYTLQYFQYYLQSALQQLQSTNLAIGSGFILPDNNFAKSFLEVVGNYLIAYEQV